MVAALDAHITQAPDIAGGKPRIAGHRITVGQIAGWHELLGWSADEIAITYQLSLGKVYVALAYYFDHQTEINLTVQESEHFINGLKQMTASKLPKKHG